MNTFRQHNMFISSLLRVHTVLLLLVVGVMQFNPTASIKILMLPCNINSHIIYFTRLAEGLSRLGNTVELIVPNNSGVKQPSAMDVNLTVSTYPVPASVPFFSTEDMSKRVVEILQTDWKLYQKLLVYNLMKYGLMEVESDCQLLLENKSLMDRIRAVNFDFAIMDSGAMQCYYVIPYSLNIPYATLSVAWFSLQYRVPRLPSFVSALGYTDVMTFPERLMTFIAEGTLIFAKAAENSTYIQTYASDKPAISAMELLTKNSLWFYLEDIALAYPNPQMPNTLSVGDIVAGQAVHELSNDLKQFICGTPDGGSVIIVSFGSYIDYVPLDWIEKFCNVFRRLKAHRIIWKLKYSEHCSLASNVLALPWIPQNDLLANDRVRLLITHGGYNSLIESVYHAKPVIVFPFAFDQPSNAVVAQHKGIGINMNLRTFTTEDLYNNIERMLIIPNNYIEAVNRASAILRDKPDDGAAQRVSNKIKHVLKHGDAHLRTGAFQLNILQYFMFDIFAFITVGVILCVAITALGLSCFCRFIARNLNILTSKMVRESGISNSKRGMKLD